MNNAIREAEGGVKLTLNFGTEKRDIILRYDMGALCALQSEMGGKSITDIEIRIRAGFDPLALRAAIWAGQLWQNPELKVSDLNNLVISADERYELMIRISKAIQNSAITEDEVQELAAGLALVDKAPDPKLILVALMRAMEDEKVKQILGTGVSGSDMPGSSSGSAQSSSGDSQSESISTSSSATRGKKKSSVKGRR